MVYKKIKRYVIRRECVTAAEKWEILTLKDRKRVLKFVEDRILTKYRRSVLKKLIGTSDRRIISLIQKHPKSEIQDKYFQINIDIREIDAFLSKFDDNLLKNSYTEFDSKTYESMIKEFEKGIEEDFKCFYTVCVWKRFCDVCRSFVDEGTSSCKCSELAD